MIIIFSILIGVSVWCFGVLAYLMFSDKGRVNCVSSTPRPISSNDMRKVVDALKANQPKMGRVTCICCGKEYYLLNYTCDDCK